MNPNRCTQTERTGKKSPKTSFNMMQQVPINKKRKTIGYLPAGTGVISSLGVTG